MRTYIHHSSDVHFLQNLRCFPQCKVAGHRQNNFCGDGIVVRMGLRSTSHIRSKNLRAVGCFRVCEKTNHVFCTGDKISSSQLDAQVAGLPLREARIVDESDGVTVSFDSSERHAWHYPWTSHKSKMDVRHTFQVHVFYTCDDGDTLECFWTGESASFRVMSMRRMLGKGGKTRRTDVLGTGTQTKRRQWVRNTINEKRIKINEIVVQRVTDSSKWVKIDGQEGYHPPAGVRNWTVEAGHYDAFFDYAKKHCGLETPVFSNKKRTSDLTVFSNKEVHGFEPTAPGEARKRSRGQAPPTAAPSRSSLSSLLYPGCVAPAMTYPASALTPVLATAPSALSARLSQLHGMSSSVSTASTSSECGSSASDSVPSSRASCSSSGCNIFSSESTSLCQGLGLSYALNQGLDYNLGGMLAQQMSQQTPAGLAAGLPDGRLKTMNASKWLHERQKLCAEGLFPE